MASNDKTTSAIFRTERRRQFRQAATGSATISRRICDKASRFSQRNLPPGGRRRICSFPTQTDYMAPRKSTRELNWPLCLLPRPQRKPATAGASAPLTLAFASLPCGIRSKSSTAATTPCPQRWLAEEEGFHQKNFQRRCSTPTIGSGDGAPGPKIKIFPIRPEILLTGMAKLQPLANFKQSHLKNGIQDATRMLLISQPIKPSADVGSGHSVVCDSNTSCRETAKMCILICRACPPLMPSLSMNSTDPS